MEKIIVLILAVFFSHSSYAVSEVVGMPCADSKTQSRRSIELQKIRDADQADRAWQANLGNGNRPNLEIMETMSKNDLARRMRVGEIFGEGCLKSAADYEAAFIVYQHGNTSGQYFQAFVWSQQAQSLGAKNIKSDVAMAVDRYLVSIGHKQLFGTQTLQARQTGCWCVHAIESSFPEALRDEYRGGLNKAYTGLEYLKILNKGTSCPSAFCNTDLQPSPKGTVPGFW